MRAIALFLVLCSPACAYSQQQEAKTKTAVPQSSPEETRKATPAIVGPTQEDKQTSERQSNTEKKTTERPPLWRDPTISNWALVGVGLLAAIIAICTLRTISRQTAATEQAVIAAQKSADAADATLKTMRETSEKELRAYILPTMGQIKRVGSSSDLFQITVDVLNCGKTPAYDYRGYLGICVRPLGDIPSETEIGERNDISQGDLGSGIKFELGGRATLESTTLSFLSAGTHAIYVFGNIAYKDIFCVTHQTKFRLFSTKDLFERGQFAGCPEGNEAN